MSVITSYLYDNKITIQILDSDPTIKTRYKVVYNRTIDVYKGVDNPITIEFKNQDQKPVNISGYTITGYIVDILNANIISNVSVTVSNATVGTANVTITEELISNLTQNQYKLAFKAVNTSDNSERPVYSDDNFGLYQEINIKQGFPGGTVFGSPSSDDVIDLGTI